ncbi:outer membrane protein assembly factor BamA [Halomonas sp. McH1-25]|uniref:outer membrane protein assembly factor BamA n=1 Tax=unclassified Halomonas TaxID=2609666 RepID=UPI001EF6BEED|nr:MULTISPECIES: outer membrane protein assembly factor BamA [unclassified Halomonas]MCG7601640.1 outer membrane protein assembly factor BamA [Halomonas sp. McH1-25]MCP1342239.1 outer membrane protein assembly factor BamA [Halomonas sp. FL8]MCP1360544.1 outer membrane protein assembly factor BamA [Halomonas sp. BBD45]MCP1366384.1 outer membrane protein assembly factor BamA [Halomonas sp. BBD48]
MKLKTLGLAVMLATSTQAAMAANFTVSDIRVEGLQRVSAASVFNAFPVSANESVDDRELAQAAKQLFATGLFEDVRLARDGDVLVIHVVERPSISRIEIEGNSQVAEEDLLKGMAETGLAEGQVLQRASLEEVERQLEQLYHSQGRYSASIDTSVEPVDRNRVQVNIDVNEGAVAKIRQINVVGNEAFDDETLRDLIQLEDRPGWFFGWFSDDEYSREKLAGDLETLRSYYLDRGYVNFAITSTQVAISPDKSKIYVTINVDEGRRYRIDDIRFAGDLTLPESQARSLVTAESGDIYSRSALTESAEALRQALGAEGFAFANVESVPEVAEGGDTVDVIFRVDPGRRAYVRRINFEGNTTTQDEVLRREMIQMEGAPASTDKISQSKQRLERLGFFRQVDVETRPVAGEPDQVDVTYNVEEQPSGSISASVGYSQSAGVIYGASLSQKNFLGTGNRVNVGAQRSDTYTNLNFGYTDPYWTLDGISRGYNLFYRETDYEDSDISTYSTDSYGGSIDFGYPINDLSRLNFGVGLEDLSIETYNDTPAEIVEYVDDQGNDAMSYKLTASWTRNNLNRGIMPTDGSYQRVALETAVPGSDAEYYKLRYNGRKLFEFRPDWSLKFSTALGYADTIGNDPYPFYENFYSGGLGSVRGFSGNTLGPATTERNDGDDDTLGGNVLVEGSVELIYPFPWVEDRRSLQTSIFMDAGNTYLTDCYAVPDGYESNCESGVDLGELRYSVGLGLSWLTPVGPLTFSVAKPLNEQEGDDTQTFQFSLGQTF